MAYKQSDNSLETTTSLTDSISTKFIHIHRKIQSIGIIRSEIKQSKESQSLHTKIADLEEQNNRFIAQAESKTSKLKAELAEMKLHAYKRQRQLALRRKNRQEKINKLRQIVCAILQSENQLSTNQLQQKIDQQYKEMCSDMHRLSSTRKQQIPALESQLCAVMPKMHNKITVLAGYQENKLENIYQLVKQSVGSLKKHYFEHKVHQEQKIDYISHLIAETLNQIQQDISLERQQREKHRQNLIRLIQQTQNRSTLSPEGRFSINY